METRNLETIQINKVNYRIHYDRSQEVITMKGSIRIHEQEDYREISDLLNLAQNECVGGIIILDLNELEFLNSLGITLISMFIINVRKDDKFKIKIQGSKSIYWQSKSLHNFKQLWDEVSIEY
jgi:hypothetical protein